MSLVLIGLASVFFLGHALKWFFAKTKIPDLLILVGLGYLIGPVLGIVQPNHLGEVGNVMATLALVVILYEGGIHLTARDLANSSLPASLISLLGFLLVAGLTTLLILAFGYSLPVALLTGLGVGSTSSAIVIPMVKPLSCSDNVKTMLSLESAFTDVLTIVTFLILVDAYASNSFDTWSAATKLGPGTLLSVVWGFFAGILWAFMKQKFTPLTKITFAGEAWALLTYGLLDFTGYNGAMGVLALGFTLANLDLLPNWARAALSPEPVSISEMSLLSEVTFLLKTFFFVYLGILIEFTAWQTTTIGILIALLIFMTRYLSVLLVVKPGTYSAMDAMVSTAMGPRGLACAVLATIPLARGIEGAETVQKILFTVVPVSIFLTAVFVALAESSIAQKILGPLFTRWNQVTPEPRN